MSELLPPILKRVKAAGHKVFTNGAYDLNIVGLRSESRVANSFDDLITVSFKNEQGVWQTRYYQATTDPGTYWLENGEKATAILCPGQYSAYRLDMHKGQYLALCQRLGPVRVYRDGDKNALLDMHPDSTQEGYFGINIHRASAAHLSTEVNRWSAGCQVMADPQAFDDFIALCQKQVSLRGWQRFTYTLLEV